MKAPTEKQIKFVEKICQILNINDFPQSSKEFSKSCFSRFISSHIDAFNQAIQDIDEDIDFVYECVGCENDVWCEYY
jgi:hypothetical protein